MHPVLEEICRAQTLPTRLDVFRRWQNELRTQVQPLLDEREALLTEQMSAKRPTRGKETAA